MSIRKDLSATQQVNPPGSDKQVVINSASSFSTDNGFTFNPTSKSITAGFNNTNTGNYTAVFGLNNTVAGSWGIVAGESNTIISSAGDNAIFGESHTVGDGVHSFSGNGGLTACVNNNNYGVGAHVSGIGAQVTYVSGSQKAGFAHAFQINSVDGLKPSTVPFLLVNDGCGAIARNTAAQTAGHGSLAQDGFILGGIDGNIPTDSQRSVILGGNAIKARATDPDQVYAPNFNITTTPLNDDALTQVLVRNGSTGQIKYRSATTFGGGGAWGTITGTLSSQTDLQSALNLKANRYLTKNTQTSNYTLVLNDSDTGLVETNSASSNNVTIPPNSSVAFTIGTQIAIVQYGIGLTSIVAGSGVVIRSSSGTLVGAGQYSSMFLIKRATDEWYLLNGTASFSNAAANTELIVSNGTNGISGKVFVPTNGNLTFGDSTLAGASRAITADGSATDVGFSFTTKGAGNFDSDARTGFTRFKGESFLLQQGTGNTNGGPYMVIAKRTANFPAGAVNSIALYGQDSSDATTTLALYTQQAVEAIGTFTPSHKLKIRLNGTEYWISLDAV